MKGHKASLHWWYQRIASYALIPLTILFLYVLSDSVSVDNTGTIMQVFQNMCIQYPLFVLVLSIILVLHMRMGMQEVIEDYVHTARTKLICFIFLNILTVRIITDAFIYLYI